MGTTGSTGDRPTGSPAQSSMSIHSAEPLTGGDEVMSTTKTTRKRAGDCQYNLANQQSNMLADDLMVRECHIIRAYCMQPEIL